MSKPKKHVLGGSTENNPNKNPESGTTRKAKNQDSAPNPVPTTIFCIIFRNLLDFARLKDTNIGLFEKIIK